MNDTDPWQRDSGHRTPQGYPPYYGRPPHRKSKWLAGLLSFLIPGVGHMYVGKMLKAIFIMLMIAGVITGIVQVAMSGGSALSIVLLSLLLPIIYFYSLFDAIQSADNVNAKLAAAKWHGNAGYPNGYSQPMPPQQPVQPHPYSMSPQPQQLSQPPFPELKGFPLKRLALVAIVILLVIFLAQETWSDWKIESTLSIIGAVLLIGAGVVMWAWELRGPHGPDGPNGPER